MKATPYELIELGLWERYCNQFGVSVWAVSEGQIDEDTELDIDWNKNMKQEE